MTRAATSDELIALRSNGQWARWRAIIDRPNTLYPARVNGSLYVDNNIVAVGDITAFSDRRLKTDIEPILEPLEKVDALNGVTYKRIDTGEYQTGLIAQEVQAVMPNAVVETDDGMLAVGNHHIRDLTR